MGQYCFAGCRRLSGLSMVVCNTCGLPAATRGHVAGLAADSARRDSTVTSR